MRRKIDDVLQQWATSDSQQPLLVRGARRVGKTYSIKNFGIEHFGKEHLAYCDFQTNLDRFESIFAGTTDIDRIVSDLSLALNIDIHKQTTLIVFDEVQLSEKALNSLRFFAGSGYKVIATGSQLGITLHNRTLPFPSEVIQEVLHPFDFEEFLWATGDERLARGIRAAFTSQTPFALHDEALEKYRIYTVVGGMPGSINSYLKTQDFEVVREAQSQIDATYTADIALYAPPESVGRTQAVWASIPKQLARESSRKFKYTDVHSGGRERLYRAPLAWLESAELVSLNYQTNNSAAPLIARDGGSFFKVYLLDTGLMFFKYNLAASTILDATMRKALSPVFRGALAENYVKQALTANNIETFYWTPTGRVSQEIEFITQTRLGTIIPIEVKSGNNVTSKSLVAFMEKTTAPLAIRISTKNFGVDNSIFSVPLYAAFCIDEKALREMGKPL